MGLPSIRHIILQDVALSSAIDQVVVSTVVIFRCVEVWMVVLMRMRVVWFRVVKMWTVIMCMRMDLWW